MTTDEAHELTEFMIQATKKMSRHYARIRRRASEDPGTAGDQGEENWASLLRNWLPSTFHVVTKGRILPPKGPASPQVDVLVLHPEYPSQLLDEKLYLASGVAAAFECKITLTRAHIRKTIQNAVKVKHCLPQRVGTPYRELHSPIVYGLLAHSHSWTKPKSKALENIDEALYDEDAKAVSHPREMLDLVCVADLASWVTTKVTFIGPKQFKEWAELAPIFGEDGSARTHYTCASRRSPSQELVFTPIGVMVSCLWNKLAMERPELRQLATYFRFSRIAGSRGSERCRPWDPSIYSDRVRRRVLAGPLSSTLWWDEWAFAFM